MRWRLPLALVAAAALGAQLVPYGRSHENPPVIADAPWPSARARDLAARACYDCHSNETKWPWYSNIAPMSWLVTRDVEDGRLALNFSQWPRDEHQLHDGAEAIEDGEMPPRRYLPLHPRARLSAAERAELMAALERMDRDRGGRRGRGGPGRQ